jgi:hypothetical protein
VTASAGSTTAPFCKILNSCTVKPACDKTVWLRHRVRGKKEAWGGGVYRARNSGSTYYE